MCITARAQLLSPSWDGDLARVTRLVESGADVNKREGGSVRTPLIGAAIMGRTSVVRYLLSQGADPDITDKDGNTAAALALAEGHRELAKELYKISPPGTPTKQPKFEHL